MRPPLIIATTLSLLLVACGPGPADGGASPISAAELAGRIQAGSPPFVLDVRTPEEYSKGHIPGAANIPHDQLTARILELPATKSAEIVIHCQSGRRAQSAATTLRGEGYSNVRDLTGHWQTWQASDLPAE